MNGRLILLLPVMLFGVGSSSFVTARETRQAVPVSIAAARIALGGDAALNAVSSFTIVGSMTRNLGPVTTDSSIEISCVLPDQFVRVTRQTIARGPIATYEITHYEGFNGDDPIHATVAPDAPFPVVIPGPAPTTPDQIAAARTRLLNGHKQIFTSLTLPFFVASFLSYPVEFTPASQIQLAADSADVIDVTAADGFTWRLLLDATTHRPVQLRWMAKPFVTFSTSSIVTVGPRGQVTGSGGGTPMPPAGDPTAAMAPVEWQLAFSDYRAVAGLTWPHRMTTIAGRLHEDFRLRTVKINPRIDPKMFRTDR